MGADGDFGTAFAMSYRDIFWLLEPELSTSIFIA
jgi:hypothetical protein